ncbi:hypothetical protein TNCV_1006861 [Trichonephila clavipes]|nr:hypothetical protein TNCV_1006861 [Trichonephila clavipes]
MDALWTFHSSANAIERYEWTQNDVQQTELVVLWFVMWLIDLTLPCMQSECDNGYCCNERCDRPRRSIVTSYIQQ